MSNLSFPRHKRGVARTAALALAFTLCFGIASPLARITRAQTLAPDDSTPTEVKQAFVIYQSPDGDVICRDATSAEAEEINRDNGVPLHQINHLKSDSTQYGTEAINATAGLHIVLNGTTQLNDPNNLMAVAAKQAFINAAAKWEALIADPITVNIDVDFGTSAFGTAFPSSTILGTTGSSGFLLQYPSIRSQLIAHALAGSEEATVLSNLPTSSLPTDIGNVSTVFMPPSQLSALNINAGTLSNPRIGFNSAFGFDFDPADGVTAGLTDFDSVAVHEIGHALGFTSEAGGTNNDATIWDFYRFRPGTTSNANFLSAQRAVSAGVDANDRRIQFNGNAEIELSTGKPDGTGGDGNQSSHWKDDHLSGIYLGIMDPSLSRGVHKSITANDIRALDFMGYNITQVTPPTSTTVQFASATQTASETSGNALITITRTGSLTGPSSVGFGTLDDTRPIRCDDTTSAPGVAFARCDYATTVQTVTFAAGEASKTVSVPLIDDSFGEPNESVTLALANPTGATFGAQPIMTLTITSNEPLGATGPNPILNTDFFIRMQYLDFLSREPEAGQPWSSVINNCSAGDTSCDRISISANFFRSQEFQLKGLFVFNFYKLSFGRLPLYAEMVADMSSVTGNSTADLNAKKALFTNAWVQRPEFSNSYAAMSNTQFVNTLMDRYSIQQITTPDPAAPDGTVKLTLTRADLISRLTAGTNTRAQVVRAIASSDQVSATEFNPAFVAMQYFGYLRRDPDTGGYNAWLQTINANPNDFRAMVNGFMNSVEYRLRFGPS
ncbi:MAG: hypothetical protein QOE33_3290 [Acidobacteriota bacterium]|nr:hypothetical protein [Acidobacteriota bacterium]